MACYLLSMFHVGGTYLGLTIRGHMFSRALLLDSQLIAVEMPEDFVQKMREQAREWFG